MATAFRVPAALVVAFPGNGNGQPTAPGQRQRAPLSGLGAGSRG